MIFKSVILFFNSKSQKPIEYTEIIEQQLKARGVRVQKICINDIPEQKTEEADAVIAIGGDGTVLHAARRAAEEQIPILGINAGNLGFLSGAGKQGFLSHIDDFLYGKFICSQRMLLSVKVLRGEETVFGPVQALNDCVIRSGGSRAFVLRTYYNHRFLAEYFGDGLIVSTPSGSTAYNLAASGPIVMPEMDLLLLSPICPHTLTHRPIILPPMKELKIELHESSSQQKHLLSLDGQTNFCLCFGDKIIINKYNKTVKLLSSKNFSYFEVLRNKLSWGER